jgi:hypothetical protein
MRKFPRGDLVLYLYMKDESSNRDGGGLHEVRRVTTIKVKQTQLGATEGTKQFVSLVASAGSGIKLCLLRSTSSARAASAVQKWLATGDSYLCTIEISAQLLQGANSIIESGNPGVIWLLNPQQLTRCRN